MVFLTLHDFLSWTLFINVLAKKAHVLAVKNHEVPKSKLSSQLHEIKFAEYQQIQFNQDKTLWKNLSTSFKIFFYHPKIYFYQAIKINEVTATAVNEVKYSSNMFYFVFLNHDIDTIKNLGFAGFKILYHVNKINKNDEIVSMLDASYFRAIGKNPDCEFSTYELAIDNTPASGKEFPSLREFWIESPRANDKQLVLYALLDYFPCTTGFYRFVIYLGHDINIDIPSHIYLRDNVKKLDLALLTSIFLFRPNQPAMTINFRPTLHNSNGFSIQVSNVKWIWRPLNNPRHLSISIFQIENPKIFNRLQHERDFFQYQELDNRYDLHPNGFVNPRWDWVEEYVELVEIPTNDETNDNIIAFWTPEKSLNPSYHPKLAYWLHFSCDKNAIHSSDFAYVKQTLHFTSDIKDILLTHQIDVTTTFLVNFVGKPPKAGCPTALVSSLISGNKNPNAIENSIQFNPITQIWRLTTLRIKLKDTKHPTELHAGLVTKNKILTETWSYLLTTNE
ncbi:MAG: glucan biosynthesis protein [Sodalis sp. (in: enterobacteria)]